MVRFGIVGALGGVLNTAFLFLLYQVLHLALLLSSLAACELAVISNFLLNDRWVFGRRSASWTRFAKFNVTAAGGVAVTAGVIWTLVGLLGMHYLVANGVALGAAGLLNLGLSVRWVWSRGR